MLVPKQASPRLNPCTRYNSDGSRCTQLTPRLDGWCGNCHGFRDPEPAFPHVPSRRPSSRRHANWTPTGGAPDELDFGDVALTHRAVTSYAAHHRCTSDEAALELKSMIEDFALHPYTKSWSNEEDALRSLTNGGYRLLFNDDWTVLRGYSPGSHLERTWAQVKVGVPTREPRFDPTHRMAGPAWYYALEAELGTPVRVAWNAATLFVHTTKGDRLKQRNARTYLPEIATRVRAAVDGWDGSEGRHVLEDGHPEPRAWTLVKEPGRAPIVCTVAFPESRAAAA
ncbi:hypothetical protein ACFU0X_10185 [Streptomyces cellulosae]|uniref:Uncharacterized protein n=1 Tax=Streptomyces cellulosae TaxID=1968 RepID=A0ABW6JDH9_STRCE